MAAAAGGLLAAISLFGSAWNASAHASPDCVITLEPGQSIQEAIDASPEGAVICLSAGEWRETITLDKDLTLRGQGVDSTSISAEGFSARREGPVIRVEAPYQGAVRIKIEGVTLKNAFSFELSSHRWPAAVLATGRVEIEIVSCALVDSGWGLFLRGAARATVRDSLISKCHVGFEASDFARFEVIGCILSGNRYPLVLQGSAHGSLIACSVSEYTYGVQAMGWARAELVGCTLATGVVGAYLWAASEALFTECTIENNTSYGIRLWDDARAVVERCMISGNGTAIGTRDRARVGITATLLLTNGSGVALHDASQASIWRNVFSMPLHPAFVPGTSARPDHCEGFRGLVVGGLNQAQEPEGIETGGTSTRCSAALVFLLTEQGGVWDRRPFP